MNWVKTGKVQVQEMERTGEGRGYGVAISCQYATDWCGSLCCQLPNLGLTEELSLEEETAGKTSASKQGLVRLPLMLA